MEDKKENNDSFNEVKIYKPKARRLCPQRKKIKCASLKSSSTSSNSEKSQIQLNIEETKMKLTNLDNISLDEINNDFLFYELNLEEAECHDELWNILNNSSENNFSMSDYQNIPKIKRCKNKIEQTHIDFLKECDIDELFNEYNSMMTQQNE